MSASTAHSLEIEGRDRARLIAVAPVRNATWMTRELDAVGSGLAFTAFAIGVCVLVTQRGRTLATVGAAFAIFGHILLAAGVFAVGVLFWYATDTDALSEQAGTGLLDYFQEHLGPVIGPQFVGFATVAMGVLVMAGALWRSGAGAGLVPRCPRRRARCPRRRIGTRARRAPGRVGAHAHRSGLVPVDGPGDLRKPRRSRRIVTPCEPGRDVEHASGSAAVLASPKTRPRVCAAIPPR
jgi:hypothetical protein